ncbi:MarR family winged helix-turn-helix transcriptional regulator [Subtercola boreus]|nr:MarR family winged helix-turn-helix transcriptional regulator [Subtercola boreus]
MDVPDQSRAGSRAFDFPAENRLPSDLPLPDALDLSQFTPRLITILSNIMSVRESQSLRQKFDLGTTDWRIIGALAQEPAMTATELSRYTVMSKAVISRKLAGLVDGGLIQQGDGPRGSRPLRLTAKGAEMYSGMWPIAYRAQRLIERTLTQPELITLESLLMRLVDATNDDGAWLD